MQTEATASRGGRPALPENERRATAINVRMRPDERAAIEARAAAANQSLMEYVRTSALAAEIKVQQTRALAPLDRHDLARVGSNLNQIARSLNMNPDLINRRQADALIRDLYAALSDVRALLKRLDDQD